MAVVLPTSICLEYLIAPPHGHDLVWHTLAYNYCASLFNLLQQWNPYPGSGEVALLRFTMAYGHRIMAYSERMHLYPNRRG